MIPSSTVRLTPNWILGLGSGFLALGLALLLASITGIAAAGDQLATAGAGLTAAGGIMIAMAQSAVAAEDRRSLFHLEEARGSVSKAFHLLADGNNDRATWTLAARLLARGKELTAEITSASHRQVLEADMDVRRVDFARLLHANAPDRAAFFMGSPNSSESIEAAVQRHELQYLPAALDRKSLKEIYDFSEYPPDYEDPIRRSFSPDDLSRIRIIMPSLGDYLDYVAEHGQPRSATRRRARRAPASE